MEVTVTGDPPSAGRKLGDLRWPPAATVISVLSGHRLRPPDSQITLSPGDRVSLLIPGTARRAPAAPGPPPRSRGQRRSQ